MESAGWWAGVAGVLTSIGWGVAWVLTWYIKDYRKQKMAEEETGYQRLSALFDSQQVRLHRQGRGIAKLRKRCTEAEKAEAVCNERLTTLEEQVKELKDEMRGTQREQTRLLTEQNEHLRVLVGEAQVQTVLKVEDLSEKAAQVKHDDETVKGE